MRDALKGFPLAALLALYCAANLVRRMIPPLAFLFPVTSLIAILLCDKLGPDVGAIFAQVLRLQDLLHFVIIQRIYSGVSAAIFHDMHDPTAVTPWAQRLMPAELAEALRVLDQGWREGRWGTRESEFRQSAVTCLFQVSMYMQDTVTIFWLSTRSGATLGTYGVGLVIALFAEYPKAVVYMMTVTAAADAVSSSDGPNLSLLLDGIRAIPWYLAMCFGILTGGCTILTHGNHVRMVVVAALQALRLSARPTASEQPRETEGQSGPGVHHEVALSAKNS